MIYSWSQIEAMHIASAQKDYVISDMLSRRYAPEYMQVCKTPLLYLDHTREPVRVNADDPEWCRSHNTPPPMVVWRARDVFRYWNVFYPDDQKDFKPWRGKSTSMA